MKTCFPVPFYSNTSDNTHCFQACLRMVLKYFQPQKEYSWKELEEISAKKEGLWTWPLATMLWMQKQGFEVVDIEVFDYTKFIQHPEKYILELYGEVAGKEQLAHSDLLQEVAFAKEILRTNIVTKKIPTVESIQKLLIDSFLPICLINAQMLNKEEEYVGHFVVIVGYDDRGFFVHDPGLPAKENRYITYEDFEKAWAAPNDQAKNVLAFKLF